MVSLKLFYYDDGSKAREVRDRKMSSVMVDLFPSTFTSYDAISVLGEGHFGNVYLCKDKGTGALVATKRIDHECFLSFKAQRHSSLTIVSEADMLKANTEDGLLHCIEHVSTGNCELLVTEYCDGGTLFDHIISAGDEEVPDALHIATQLLQSVFHIHQRCVVHRDIKPGNVFCVLPHHDPRLF